MLFLEFFQNLFFPKKKNDGGNCQDLLVVAYLWLYL